jgi:hypothetical protein
VIVKGIEDPPLYVFQKHCWPAIPRERISENSRIRRRVLNGKKPISIGLLLTPPKKGARSLVQQTIRFIGSESVASCDQFASLILRIK